MNSVYLLERYEDIADFSAMMLAAARAGDWTEVARLQSSAGMAIDEVRALSAIVALTAQERRAKLASMGRILSNDGQIQELSQPWLGQVTRWLRAGGPESGQFEGVLR